MEELGNIAVFLAGWNSEYQTRLINGIIRKAKEQTMQSLFFPVRQGVRFRTSMCLEKIKYIRWLIFRVLMA